MEREITPPQQPLPPTQDAAMTKQKQNGTLWVIIALVLLASLMTGLAYLFIGRMTQQQTASVLTPTPSVITSEDTNWEKYTDLKNQYSFYYPDTWTIQTQPNGEGFTLTYNDPQKPGQIIGKFLTQKEQDATEICQDATKICQSKDLSSTTKLFTELTLENNEPTIIKAIIPRPKGQVIDIEVTQPNFDSYQTFGTIIDTITFQNETKVNKIQFCPDSRSADGKTVTYNNATFPIEEVDQDYINTECQQ